MTGWVIVAVVAIVTSSIAGIIKSIANAKAGSGGSGPLNARVDALEQEMATVRQELVEAQERLDFTERLLAKQKDASRLGGQS